MALATNNLEVLSLANHDFSLSLYSKFNQQDGNIFYSPLSIHLVMFMASIGAAAKTLDEIVNTLHLTKNNTALDAYKELLDNLNNDDVLKIATGMFVDNSFKIKQSYLEKTGKYLQSSLDKLDFKGNPEVQRVYINNWVQNKTNGKIKDLFPEGSIQSDTPLVLANAVHFKSSWKHEFHNTQDGAFFLTPENQTIVKMMSLRKDLLYYHDGELKYTALELPYKNSFFSMIILLPDAKDGLKDLENNLHKIKLNKLPNKMTTYKVNVKLPQFKLEQTIDLHSVLIELGCASMFSPSANFSEICESNTDSLYVTKVLHKAYINVDEKGTEAAAATGIGFSMKSAYDSNRENADFIADHPFIVAIVTNGGDVIFLGRKCIFLDTNDHSGERIISVYSSLSVFLGVNTNLYISAYSHCFRPLTASVSFYALVGRSILFLQAGHAMDSTITNVSSYTASTTNFSFAFYNELSNTEGNLFASTYSIHLLLLLLTIGSKSKTYDELTNTLRLPKNKSPNFEKFKSIIEDIENPSYLTVANGVFANKAFDLNADYENQARNYLKAEVRKLDFANTGEKEINDWTKAKTNGKITELFKPGVINADSSLVLASAVHFKSRWDSLFMEVKKESFCLSATNHIDVQMMHQTDYFDYYKNDNDKFAAIKLPYKGSEFSMVVILPDKMDGVRDVEKVVLKNSKHFPILLANMTTHKVVLAMPKFKFESDLNLQKPLKQLGCSTMFTSDADLSKLSASETGKLMVSDIVHKTYVDVNEEGTEAAAITGANLVLYSAPYFSPHVKTVHFHACHPFMFFIIKGNDVIFTGRLADPTK
ncbi:uncharacterized protein LOC126839339 [Adelges cooleyi]|uniref:uncharacterized protein LOC126839339 n=1 Tax=Adelges cooleyi TaxID=133065 RepID=UPI00218025E0|nr:uncharacterized protein LOC126839339 [Adelges cooleyi]